MKWVEIVSPGMEFLDPIKDAPDFPLSRQVAYRKFGSHTLGPTKNSEVSRAFPKEYQTTLRTPFGEATVISPWTFYESAKLNVTCLAAKRVNMRVVDLKEEPWAALTMRDFSRFPDMLMANGHCERYLFGDA